MPALSNHFAQPSQAQEIAPMAWFRQILTWAWLVALVILPAAAAAEDYRLAPGDVLRVMIVGNPELSVDVPIEMDGTAWFPLVGPIIAGGETLQNLRVRTAEAYATMSLSRPVSSSGEVAQIIDSRQVYVAVAAYRPIYVTGDVGTVREVPFRPGLTLRHLFALTSVETPSDRSQAATPGEIEAASSALAHEYAQIWRQKTFLGIDTPADFDRIFVAKGGVFDEIAAVEQSILEETRAGLKAQKQQLRDEVSRIKAHVLVLSRQQDSEKQGLTIDEETLATVQDLFSRNLVPASRLTEVRRAALVTASRVFQIDVAVENARRQIASLEADILAVDRDARAGAWNDIGEAVARVQQRRSDLETLIARTEGNPDSDQPPVEAKAIVTRDGVTLAPTETPLSLAVMPGDIVEIRLMPQGSGASSDKPEAKG